MKYSKAPWVVISHPLWNGAMVRIDNKITEWGNFGQICYASKADAERIVACVNACVGISNEDLLKGVEVKNDKTRKS